MLRKFSFIADGKVVYSIGMQDSVDFVRTFVRTLSSGPTVVDATAYGESLIGCRYVDGTFVSGEGNTAAEASEISTDRRVYALVVDGEVRSTLTITQADMDEEEYQAAVDGMSQSPQVVEVFEQSGSYYAAADYGGCLVGTTLVPTPDGRKAVQDLQVGDTVYAMVAAELSPYETPYTVGTWSSMTLTPMAITRTKIASVRLMRVSNACVQVNNADKFSVEQLVLVRREDRYRFVTAEFLQEGDVLLALSHTDPVVLSPVVVTSVETRSEFNVVYLFATERGEVMFTENALVCNMKL